MSSYSTQTPGGWLTDVITRNPEGLLLLAAGAALLMRKSSSTQHGFQVKQRWDDVRHSDADRNGPRKFSETVGEAARSVGDYASDVSEKVRDNVSSYAASVAEYADHASESSTRIARQARSTVGNSIQAVLRDQPLTVAVAGAALGAAVAAAFPPTEIEKRNLGPAGKRLKEAAGKAGEQIKEAGVQAKDKLVSAAEDRGLTADGLKEMVQEVGDAFSQALSEDQASLQPSPSGSARHAGQSPATRTGNLGSEREPQ
jgi:hypothetical protein